MRIKFGIRNEYRVVEIVNVYIHTNKEYPLKRWLVCEPAKELMMGIGGSILHRMNLEDHEVYCIREENLTEGETLEGIMQKLLEQGYYDFDEKMYEKMYKGLSKAVSV